MNKKNQRDERIGEKDEFEQKLVEVKRVTRVKAGGKKLSFRACMVVGDRKGNVGMGVAKGADVAIAVGKAVNKARKDMIKVPIVKGTILHEIQEKFKSAIVLLKPASKGRGVIAGGAVRVVLSLAGIDNVSGKILGSNNKINNIRATINALSKFKIKKAKKRKNKKTKKQEFKNIKI